MGDVSIYDVAKVAGVHSSTVSRAFSRPEAVKPETRERILRIAGEMGYRVNSLGQALRRGSSNLVPLIVPDITNPFYGELAKSVAAAAGLRGYQVVLCLTEGDADETYRFLDAMSAHLSPFAIVAPSTRIDAGVLERTALARRTVIIDRVPQGLQVPTVFIDNRLGVKLALDHLLELGHRRIAYLTGTVGTYSAEVRVEAYRALVADHGIEPVVIRGGYSLAATERGAAEFLAIDPRPTAVIASNDLAAFGFISRLAEHGVRVPEDVSVTGFDGVPIGDNFNPGITTVAQPFDELGALAVAVAERFADDGSIVHEVLVPTLLVRRSTRRLL